MTSPPTEPRGAEERPALPCLGQSLAAHRHALIALLTRKVERGGAVVVRGVHHCALGNQEVNEGRLPCRTEGKKGGFLKPVSEAMTSFLLSSAGVRQARRHFSAWGGTRANVKSHAVDSGHSGGGAPPLEGVRLQPHPPQPLCHSHRRKEKRALDAHRRVHGASLHRMEYCATMKNKYRHTEMFLYVA